MVVKRKKTIIDGMDRDLLRNLFKSRRPLTANQLSKKINLSASAIRPRLNNLQTQGIVKPMKVSGMRQFQRTFGNKKVQIKSPRSILWDIDLVSSKKKKRR